MTPDALPFVPEKYMTDEVVVEEFIRMAFEDGDPAEIVHHLQIISRSPYFAERAARPGSDLPALAAELNGNGNPEFATIMKMLEALGIKLSVQVTSAVGQSAA